MPMDFPILSESITSPITGAAVTISQTTGRAHTWQVSDSPLAWFVLDPVFDVIKAPRDGYKSNGHQFSAKELTDGWTVVRSKWWLSGIKKAPPFWVITQAHFNDRMSREDPELHLYNFVSLDACIRESKLGFEAKCSKTLENFDAFWRVSIGPVLTGYEVAVQEGGELVLKLGQRQSVREGEWPMVVMRERRPTCTCSCKSVVGSCPMVAMAGIRGPTAKSNWTGYASSGLAERAYRRTMAIRWKLVGKYSWYMAIAMRSVMRWRDSSIKLG